MPTVFIRPGYLASVSSTSKVGIIMFHMEAAYVNKDVAEVARGYAYFMANMGAHGQQGAAEDNAIAEYLEQFDAAFE